MQTAGKLVPQQTRDFAKFDTSPILASTASLILSPIPPDCVIPVLAPTIRLAPPIPPPAAEGWE